MVLNLILLFLLSFPSFAKPEKFYQNIWCGEHGIQEYRLQDKTRVDCLTDTHAIELDKAQKWTEAIGQSLHYAKLSGKRAGVVLIIEEPKENKYWNRLNSVIKHYKLPIDTYKINGY